MFRAYASQSDEPSDGRLPLSDVIKPVKFVRSMPDASVILGGRFAEDAYQLGLQRLDDTSSRSSSSPTPSEPVSISGRSEKRSAQLVDDRSKEKAKKVKAKKVSSKSIFIEDFGDDGPPKPYILARKPRPWNRRLSNYKQRPPSLDMVLGGAHLLLSRLKLAGKTKASSAGRVDALWWRYFADQSEPVGSKQSGQHQEADAASDDIVEQRKEYMRLIALKPFDIGQWLSFVDFQQRVLDSELRGVQCSRLNRKKLVLEKKLAVLESASRDYGVVAYALARKRLDLVVEADAAGINLSTEGTTSVEESSKQQVAEEWRRLLTGFASSHAELWPEYLQFLTSTAASTEAVVESFLKCFRMLRAHAGNSLSAGLIIHVVFERLLAFLFDAGLQERAVGLIQCQLELNLFQPAVVSNQTEAVRLLGQYWDYEVPRIGESGFVGWRQARRLATDFMKSTSSGSAADDDAVGLFVRKHCQQICANVPRNLLVPSVSGWYSQTEESLLQNVATNVEAWLTIEKLRSCLHWLPLRLSASLTGDPSVDDCSAGDTAGEQCEEDPERVPIFDQELAPFLYEINADVRPFQLVDCVCCFVDLLLGEDEVLVGGQRSRFTWSHVALQCWASCNVAPSNQLLGDRLRASGGLDPLPNLALLQRLLFAENLIVQVETELRRIGGVDGDFFASVLTTRLLLLKRRLADVSAQVPSVTGNRMGNFSRECKVLLRRESCRSDLLVWSCFLGLSAKEQAEKGQSVEALIKQADQLSRAFLDQSTGFTLDAFDCLLAIRQVLGWLCLNVTHCLMVVQGAHQQFSAGDWTQTNLDETAASIRSICRRTMLVPDEAADELVANALDTVCGRCLAALRFHARRTDAADAIGQLAGLTLAGACTSFLTGFFDYFCSFDYDVARSLLFADLELPSTSRAGSAEALLSDYVRQMLLLIADWNLLLLGFDRPQRTFKQYRLGLEEAMLVSGGCNGGVGAVVSGSVLDEYVTCEASSGLLMHLRQVFAQLNRRCSAIPLIAANDTASGSHADEDSHLVGSGSVGDERCLLICGLALAEWMRLERVLAAGQDSTDLTDSGVVHRVRSLLGKTTELRPHEAQLWMLRLSFESSIGSSNSSQLHMAVYEALSRCPFSKTLHLMAIQLMSSGRFDELRSTLVERQMRVHLPVEELEILLTVSRPDLLAEQTPADAPRDAGNDTDGQANDTDKTDTT